jgi:predicted RNA-binding Zn-ribbon protein involved in translation (DUF1610 family)
MSGPYKGCYDCGWCIHLSQAGDYVYCPKCGQQLGVQSDTRDFDKDQPGIAQAIELLERNGFRVSKMV